MIVTCPSCQKRFQLPPDRIGPSGARIRCGGCKAVFRLPAAGETPFPGTERAGPGPSGMAAVRTPGPPEGARPRRAADPFAPAASPNPAGASSDPFAAGAADPFAADLGPDPFSLAAPAAVTPSSVEAAAEALRAAVAPVPQLTPPPIPAPRPTPAPGPGPEALSLEDAAPRPRASPPPLPARTPPGSEPAGAEPAERTELVEIPRHDDDLDLARPELLSSSAAAPEAPAREPEPAPRAAAAPEPAGAATATAALPRLRRRPALAPAVSNSMSLLLLLALTAGFFSWRGDLGRKVLGALGPAPAGPVEAAGVHAGLYDTAAGPAVLVVRGEVRARGAVAGRVRVRVELVEGGRTVATADALAGASAGPEEVFAAGTPDDAASLRRSLDARAVGALAAGGAAPFLAVIPAPLPDVAQLEVRTTAEVAPAP